MASLHIPSGIADHICEPNNWRNFAKNDASKTPDASIDEVFTPWAFVESSVDSLFLYSVAQGNQNTIL